MASVDRVVVHTFLVIPIAITLMIIMPVFSTINAPPGEKVRTVLTTIAVIWVPLLLYIGTVEFLGHKKITGRVLFEQRKSFRGRVARSFLGQIKSTLTSAHKKSGNASDTTKEAVKIAIDTDSQTHTNDQDTSHHSQPLESNTIPIECDFESIERRQEHHLGSYTYKPLHDDEIRLLQIEGLDSGSEKIRATLIHIPLLTAGAKGYTALSYTWGSQDATSVIYLDGENMTIRPNLENILRKMLSLGHRLVWVDAICVNQDDLQECGAQVVRMRYIYAEAGSTIVAVDAEGMDKRWLSQLLEYLRPEYGVENHAEAVKMGENEWAQAHLSWFCDANYWKRIWIIQEFAISHKLLFLVGDALITEDKLSFLIKIWEHPSHSVRRDQVKAVFEIRESWKKKKPIGLLDILSRTKTSLCGRRHDRVFGLIGLSLDALEFVSEPNYQIDWRELATHMTRSYVMKHSLDLILLASRSSLDLSLASWSPNYFEFDKCPPEERCFKIIASHSPRNELNSLYVHRGRWAATGYSRGDFYFSGSSLVTSAHRIGEIYSLSAAWSDPTDGAYPTHDPLMSKYPRDNVAEMLMSAMLTSDNTYNYTSPAPIHGSYRWIPNFLQIPAYNFVLSYAYLSAFHPDHNWSDTDEPLPGIVQWLCRNRDFVAAGRSLGEYAAELGHPARHIGLATWHLSVALNKSVHWPMKRMAEANMRMMCLDNAEFGIGWAALGARVYDEVFLVPGVSSPVVLRRREDGRYYFIGDAVVIGAMEGEVWKGVDGEELVKVEIV